MQVNYCDFCGLPIRRGRHVIQIVHDLEYMAENPRRPYSQQQRKVNYEVCTKCIDLVHEVFTVRKKGLEYLKENIKNSFDMGTKEGDSENGKR